MADINQFIDQNLINQLEKLNQEIIDTGNSIDKKLLPSIDKLEQAQKELQKTTAGNADASKRLNAASKEAESIAKRLLQAEAKLNSVRKGQQDQLLKIQQQTQKELQLRRQIIKAKEAERNSNARLSATISILEKKLAGVNQKTEEGRKRADAWKKSIDRLNTQLTKQSSALNRQRRNIGNYASAVRGAAMQFAGALGLTSAVFLFVNTLKGAFSTIREFTKQQAVLAGVIGVTRDEVRNLTEQAIQLGAVYPVTASQVSELQIAYSRLGFTQSEILQLTGATIKGSIALNSELGETATLVGAVVKAYQNLGTSDTADIVDKLTLSTQRSALSFESLEVALPKVAGAANAVNVSLDETLALLGIAQDATLDASISGTSLRNIFLELSKQGLTLNDGLEQINTSANRLETAYDLFGKRAAIVALALANNTEKIRDFREELSEAGGTADRVAKEQINTLDGAIKGLGSSWEKLVLGFKDSEGTISGVVKEVSTQLNIVSSDFLSFGQKILATNFVTGKKIRKQNDDFAKAFSELNRAQNREEVKSLELKFIDLLRKNQKFNEAFILAADQKNAQLSKSEEDAAKREELAIQQAEIERIATEKERTEEEKKESEKRIKQQERETKERIVQWKKEVLFKADQVKRINEANEEIEANFTEIIEDEFDNYSSTLDDEVAATIKFVDDVLKERERLIDEQEKLDKTAEVNRIAQQEATRQAAFDLGNTIFDFRLSRLDAELAAAEGNEEEQAKIRKKIARSEKAQALFNIGINTASAIVKALPNVALSVIVGAIGAIQAATVLATPIPAFAKGTNFAPGGLSLVGEKGRELIERPNGEVFLANNPALVNLERGSKVITNQRTEAMLNDANIVGELRQTRKAIQRIPQPIFKNGSKIAERRGNFWKEYRNAKHRVN